MGYPFSVCVAFPRPRYPRSSYRRLASPFRGRCTGYPLVVSIEQPTYLRVLKNRKLYPVPNTYLYAKAFMLESLEMKISKSVDSVIFYSCSAWKMLMAYYEEKIRLYFGNTYT